MKKILFYFSIVLLSVSLVTSCKKKEEEEVKELDENTKQFTEDSNDLKAELDNVDNDINSSLENTSLGGRLAETYSSPLCGVLIDTSQIANKIIFYNFDGTTPCFSPSRTRAGQIKVQLVQGNRWRDAGSVLRITYINFKVTRLSDNKFITLNGEKSLTNVSGINWITFLAGSSNYQLKERALNLQVNFSSGSTATWNSARTTLWQWISANAAPGIPYGHVKFTSTGDTIINSFSNTESWGVNRFGHPFVTHFISPWVSNSYCGFWRPNSGTISHLVNGSTYTLTAGLDQNGNPSTTACAYGYKIEWTPLGGTPQSTILSY